MVMYREVNGRWGPCRFLGKDEYVGRSLFSYGEYGPDETEAILDMASGVCLDIGANIGVIGQALRSRGFKVIGFEPQPELAEIAEWNYDHAETMGNTPKGVIINCALGANEGVAEMPKVQYSSKGNFGGLAIGDTSIYGSYEVPVHTLDSYSLDCGFMKIDVEGYELEVLRGAVQTIERCKPIMYIEDDRQNKSSALRTFIRELGYSIEEHKPTLYRENNFFGLKKNIWDRNYASHNLIARPI
jgi:FkbM family methyltransferase